MPPSRPRDHALVTARAQMPNDPRREISIESDPPLERMRPPTGLNWADAPTTTGDLLSFMSLISEVRIESRVAVMRIDALEEDKRAFEQERLEHAKTKASHMEEAAEADQLQKLRDRKQLRTQLFLLVLGAVLGFVGAQIAKHW